MIRGGKNPSTGVENGPMDSRRVRREIQVATIRASCPTCGDVELTTRDVTVQVCSSNNEGSYSFLCPHCNLAVSKPAEARIVDLLVSSGVRLSVWHMPAELEEPRARAVRLLPATLDLLVAELHPDPVPVQELAAEDARYAGRPAVFLEDLALSKEVGSSKARVTTR